MLLAAVLAIFELSSFDLALQDHFYDFASGRWCVDQKEPVGRLLFYTDPKALAISVGVACGACFAASFRYRRRLLAWRRPCLLIALSLTLVPLSVAGIKRLTRAHTPSQIQRYGGRSPYVKVLEKYPQDPKSSSVARNFPAGHATAGFAFMMLYFARPRRKWLGLAAGLAMGWITGGYQTLNGEHYLSHTIVTMLVAWLVILLIRLWASRVAWLPQVDSIRRP